MSKAWWQDRITNEEDRRRCGVENLEHRLRKMRFRWFGHVKCRDENSILGRVMELEVESRRPVGRPKKTWSKVLEEDMGKLNITEDIWQRIENNGGNSYHLELQKWETNDVYNENDDDDVFIMCSLCPLSSIKSLQIIIFYSFLENTIPSRFNKIITNKIIYFIHLENAIPSRFLTSIFGPSCNTLQLGTWDS